MNFTFEKGEGLLIIPGRTFLFCHIVLGHISIAMHFIFVKVSHNSVLLISNPSKRGDVEILARSSVSPPPQVKNDA